MQYRCQNFESFIILLLLNLPYLATSYHAVTPAEANPFNECNRRDVQGMQKIRGLAPLDSTLMDSW